jgi:hypothetical protein
MEGSIASLALRARVADFARNSVPLPGYFD